MKNLLIIAITFSLVQCEPVIPQKSTAQKQIIFDNHDYEDLVGNVKVVPILRGTADYLGNPVVNLNTSDQLFLEFDLLTDQFENLSLKLFHCNKDWTQSRLRDMEFLNEINNYRITEFDYSVNTIQPYINYRITLPKPKISGNYIVSVHRRGTPNDILFTRKIMVYKPVVSIDQIVRVSTTVNKREINQQIEFSISYGDLQVNAPNQDISPVILQNHNWLMAIKDIPPTLIRVNDGTMEYRHLDLKTNFAGFNEFRWTDLRTLSIAGRNVAKIETKPNEIVAMLGTDQSRAAKRYSQNFQDINGNYIVQNNDPGESTLNADYTKATFILQSERISGNVFVTGRFNEWRLGGMNQMRYDETNELYFTNLTLKQGYYDYQYVVVDSSKPSYHFEGSHFQTENDYEILVYYRKPGNINDELMGYKKFKSIEDL